MDSWRRETWTRVGARRATVAAIVLLVSIAWLARGSAEDAPPPRDAHTRDQARAVPVTAVPAASSGIEAPTAPVAPTLPASAALIVRVVDDLGRPDPEAWAEPLVCPGFRVAAGAAPADGLPYRAFVGPCRLQAARDDGMVRTYGPPTDVVVAPDGALVTLIIPSARSGGMQMAFRSADDGIAVAWLPDDSPLARAGVRQGDVIHAVDGQPLADLEPDEIRALLTGPVGGRVLVEITPHDLDTAAGPVLLELERELILPP